MSLGQKPVALLIFRFDSIAFRVWLQLRSIKWLYMYNEFISVLRWYATDAIKYACDVL